MKIFYLDDENGTFLSTDGRRRFVRLVGGEVLSYIKENRPQEVYFFTTTTEEESGDLVFVEIPEDSVSKFRKDINHENYMNQIKKDSPIVCISLLDQTEGEEDLTVQDTIIDESVNVEDEVINAIEREMLHRVLMTLSDEELRIIRDLFNSKTKITEEVLAERLGISQPAVNKRKSSILKKLKKYFDF